MQWGALGRVTVITLLAHTYCIYTFPYTHSLMTPKGKLVCCDAGDLLGDEKSPGPSTVTGLKWTLSAPNHIWRLAPRLFLTPSPPPHSPLHPLFSFFPAALWNQRPRRDSLTSWWTGGEEILGTDWLFPRTNIKVEVCGVTEQVLQLGSK